MQYIPNVCLATVIIVQYVLLYGLYEYIRDVDAKCSNLEAAVAANRRFRRDVNIAENSVSSKSEGGGQSVEFINPNFRPIVEKETIAKAGDQLNGTREEWYWLNAYSRIPVRRVYGFLERFAPQFTLTVILLYLQYVLGGRFKGILRIYQRILSARQRRAHRSKRGAWRKRSTWDQRYINLVNV